MAARRTAVRFVLAAALPALAIAAGGCPVSPADTPVVEFSRTTQNTRAGYWLYVPSTYKPDRLWPMLVTLHGTPGFDSAAAQAKEWRGLAEEHGFLVLAPSLKSTQGVLPVGRSSRLKSLEQDEARVLEAVAETQKQYRVDPAAVMISGFSAGGYPLYYIGLRNARLFSAIIARTANCDMKILEKLPVTAKLQATPILIFFSKTGINPISSHLNPVANQSWAAYRYLRLAGCKAARIKSVRGGHQRHADQAFAFWRKHQPQLRTPPP